MSYQNYSINISQQQLILVINNDGSKEYTNFVSAIKKVVGKSAQQTEPLITNLQQLLQNSSIELLPNQGARIIFQNTALATNFVEELFNIGIENRGMSGSRRKINVLTADLKYNQECYAIDLTTDEWNALNFGHPQQQPMTQLNEFSEFGEVNINKASLAITFTFDAKSTKTFVERLKRFSKTWGKKEGFQSDFVVLAGKIEVLLANQTLPTSAFDYQPLLFNENATSLSHSSPSSSNSFPFFATNPSQTTIPIASTINASSMPFFNQTSAIQTQTFIPSNPNINHTSTNELIVEQQFDYGLPDENPERKIIASHYGLKG